MKTVTPQRSSILTSIAPEVSAIRARTVRYKSRSADRGTSLIEIRIGPFKLCVPS
jgi:hypothetical protein